MSDPSDYTAEEHQLAESLGYPSQPPSPHSEDDE